MKRVYKFLIVVVLAGIVFFGYTFYTTGYFRNIESKFQGSLEKRIDLPGVEDMQISPLQDFIILSSDDRAARRDGIPQKGHLYYIDLSNRAFEPKILTENLNFEFNPHGISIVQTSPLSYHIYVVNHVNEHHTIEVFEFNDKILTHLETIENQFLISPNDIVALGENRFYFTNDHKYTKGVLKFAEDYLGFALSNVIYFDGKEYKEVASGIAYANGIAMDKSRNLIFVASPRKFLIKVFDVNEDGTLKFIENIKCNTGVDNIEIQQDGSLLVGCHPSLLAFTAYYNGDSEKSPSEVISIDYRSKGNYDIKTLFLDDGTKMSSSSVATQYEDYMFVGNVLDDHFLILKIDP